MRKPAIARARAHYPRVQPRTISSRVRLNKPVVFIKNCRILATGVLNQSKLEDLVNQMTEKFRGRIRHLTQIGALMALIAIGGYVTGTLLDQLIINPPAASAVEDARCEHNECLWSDCEWDDASFSHTCYGRECARLPETTGNCRMTEGGGCENYSCSRWFW